jgi:hypothetical protein
MARSLTFALSLLAACTARSEPMAEAAEPEESDETLLARFDQSVRSPDLLEVYESEVEVYTTLDEVLQANQELCDPPPCGPSSTTIRFRTRVAAGTSATPPHWPLQQAIEEVALAGVHRNSSCSWRLAVRSAAGWLTPLYLGSSARGCRSALDDDAIGSWEPLWFPIGVEIVGATLRIEAQVFEREGLDTVWDDPKAVVTVTRRREVTLCQLHALGPGVLACTAKAEGDRSLRGDASTLYSAPPFASGSAELPWSDADKVGSVLPARWLLTPIAGSADENVGHLARLLDSYEPIRIEVYPLGPGLPTVVVRRDSPALLLLDRGRATPLSSQRANYLNERVVGTGSGGAGLVRVDFERTVEGGTTVAWRWAELVTATHWVRLATGVTITSAGARVSGWDREVRADLSGVTLSGSSGELAWFRGTGRYTFEGLASAVARWRLGFARAWSAVADEPLRMPATEVEDGKDAVGRLVTVPGFAEPVNWTVSDEVEVLPGR